MNYTYAYIYTINAITLELNFFADMNIKLFTTLLQKSLLVSLYISYIYQRKIFFCPPKAWFPFTDPLSLINFAVSRST